MIIVAPFGKSSRAFRSLWTRDVDGGRMDSRGGLRGERHPASSSETPRTAMKSLLLSSASVLVAFGAQAADLPVKAKPVEYVKICNLYGAGFYYIPGTDTCIKIGGMVWASVSSESANGFTWVGFGGVQQFNN